MKNKIKIYEHQNDAGLFIKEYFYYSNHTAIFHRKDGPAYIEYDANEIHCELYYYNDALHRIGGPAQIEYENGKICKEIYYVNSNLHRIDGPALIEYDENGYVKYKSFWLNDEFQTTSQEIFDKITKTLLLK